MKKRYERKSHEDAFVRKGKDPLDIALSAFTFQQLQIFKNVILTLIHYGYNPADVVNYVDIRTLGTHPFIKLNCTECNHLITLLPVNNQDNNMLDTHPDAKIWAICSSCGKDYLTQDLMTLAAEYKADIKERDDLFTREVTK